MQCCSDFNYVSRQQFWEYYTVAGWILAVIQELGCPKLAQIYDVNINMLKICSSISTIFSAYINYKGGQEEVINVLQYKCRERKTLKLASVNYYKNLNLY